MPAMALDRFINHGDGTVTDTRTGLMWAAKDNGSHINWKTARSYCQNYRGGGHPDWRMPTIVELAGLYDPKEKNKRGYHVTKLIGTSAASCCCSLQFHLRQCVLAPSVLLRPHPGLAGAEWQLNTPIFPLDSLFVNRQSLVDYHLI
ncbi:MAG: DUF1566 domain-containing protein [Deltaproteobacteria bacterium]|nr:DUF1566 domain-containing protein [Deltaproteobacteria bacterium]